MNQQRKKNDLCKTMDGFNLTKFLTFVMAEIKMVDPNCINTKTGAKELCLLLKKFLPQSRRWCFPMKITMVKESSEMYQEEFEALFDLFYKASLPNQEIFPGWKPVNYTHSCNMSAQQTTLGFVGATKVKNYFCHVCTCHSKDIAKPNKGNLI